jgi:hypothetical protein
VDITDPKHNEDTVEPSRFHSGNTRHWSVPHAAAMDRRSWMERWHRQTSVTLSIPCSGRNRFKFDVVSCRDISVSVEDHF